jgi:F0F1-type ATP synthase membrane subunit b/b'
LKQVREVEKKILPIDPLLNALDRVIDEIQEANLTLKDAHHHNDGSFEAVQKVLSELRKEAASYRSQATYMGKQAQSTANSILDSLNLGFQKLAQNQSNSTFVMARSAREDSVAIRAITLVTSFYLPFSFVAVSLLSSTVAADD